MENLDMERILSAILDLQKTVNHISSDIVEMKSDIVEMKSDIGNLQLEQSSMKDILYSMAERQSNFENNINQRFNQIDRKFDTTNERLYAIEGTQETIKASMTFMSHSYDTIDNDNKYFHNVIFNHHKRIKRLEDKDKLI
jgi:regulator of replication initiation timing